MATINLSDYKPLDIKNADEFNIGIVVSEWNDFVTFNLRDAAIETLLKEGVKKDKIKIYYVPGAFELSYAAMRLCAEQRYFDAVITIGCVIRGETPILIMFAKVLHKALQHVIHKQTPQQYSVCLQMIPKNNL